MLQRPACFDLGLVSRVQIFLALITRTIVHASEPSQGFELLAEIQNCKCLSSTCSGSVAAVSSEADLDVSVSLVQKKAAPVEIFHGAAKRPPNLTGAAATDTASAHDGSGDPVVNRAREEKLKGLAKAMHENWMNISEAAGQLDEETQARLMHAIKHHLVKAASWPEAYYEYVNKDRLLRHPLLSKFSLFQSVIVATGEVVCNTSNDILVLMPLFLGRDKVKLAGMYMVIKIILSFLLSWAASPWQVRSPVSYSVTAKLLSIILPAAVSLKFFLEWYRSEDDDEEFEHQPRASGRAAGAAEENQSPSAPDSAKGAEAGLQLLQRLLSSLSAAMPSGRQRARYWILLQLCLATNFDKFGVFSNLIAMKMTYVDLFFGHLIASLLIALTLLGLSQLSMIKFTFSRIPLWFMLLLITMYALTCQLYLMFVNSMLMNGS